MAKHTAAGPSTAQAQSYQIQSSIIKMMINYRQRILRYKLGTDSFLLSTGKSRCY